MALKPDPRTVALRLIAEHGVEAFDLHQVGNRLIVVGAFTRRTDGRQRKRAKPLDARRPKRRRD
jgi:hypothetical protein